MLILNASVTFCSAVVNALQIICNETKFEFKIKDRGQQKQEFAGLELGLGGRPLVIGVDSSHLERTDFGIVVWAEFPNSKERSCESG